MYRKSRSIKIHQPSYYEGSGHCVCATCEQRLLYLWWKVGQLEWADFHNWFKVPLWSVACWSKTTASWLMQCFLSQSLAPLSFFISFPFIPHRQSVFYLLPDAMLLSRNIFLQWVKKISSSMEKQLTQINYMQHHLHYMHIIWSLCVVCMMEESRYNPLLFEFTKNHMTRSTVWHFSPFIVFVAEAFW